MTRRLAAAIVGLVLISACDWFTPHQPRGAFTPRPEETAAPCDACGTPQRGPATIYRVEGPATATVGKPVTFTIYGAAGLDETLVCESPLPTVDLGGWGVDAGTTPPKLKLGLAMRSFVREESRPCAVVDRAAPPRAFKAKRSITFPAAGTYAIEVVGYDGTRPLGMLYSPGPDDPGAPPAPSVPESIEVTP